MSIENFISNLFGGAKKRSPKRKSPRRKSKSLKKRSPTVSAGTVSVGNKRKGQDGKMYESRRSINGVAFWKKCGGKTKCSGGIRKAIGPMGPDNSMVIGGGKKQSPKRKSRSIKRKSPKRKSRSIKRKSPKRKSRSVKRKSPKRKSRSIKRKSKSPKIVYAIRYLKF